jgi:tripartite-type tricarboxylate transporter receptor subunit TctC
MSFSRVVAIGLVAGVEVFCSSAACAQDGFPSKVIRIVAPAAGGGSDAVARMIAPGLAASLGQQVIVDNRGAISAEIVAKAPPDGYTLLVDGSPLWLLPLFRPGMQWDAVRDFAPVTMALSSPSILVVHPSLPVKSVKELIAMARARPGQLNYAAGTIGATPHLAAELFKAMASVNIVRVAYKGTGPGVIGLLGGEVELMFPNAGSALPHIGSGRLRALAVCSAQPSALVPGMPTLAAMVPGYESISPQGVVAPAKTPAAIVNRLHQEIVRVLTQADTRQKLLNSGAEVVANSPEEFAAKMKADIARTNKLIKESGIRDD